MVMVAENRGQSTCCSMQVSYMKADGNNVPRKKYKITSKGEWDVPEDKLIGSTVKDVVDYGKRDRIAGGGVKRSGVKTKVKEPTTPICSGKRRAEISCDGQRRKKPKMDCSLKHQLSKILNDVMNHHSAGIFKEPVDPVKLRIPDYFSIITKPMDLGTVLHKLEGNMYYGADEFAADVRLTFSNAMRYNPPGNAVHYWAKILDGYFSRKWKPLEAKLKHGEKKDEEARLTDYMGNSGQRTKQSVEVNQKNRKPIGLNKDPLLRLVSLEEKEKFRQEVVQTLCKEMMEKLRIVFQKFGLAGVDKKTLISYIGSIDDETFWRFRSEVKHILGARDGKVQPGGKIAYNGCSSLNKTVEKSRHCSRSALACAASANLSQSIATTEARCSSHVSWKCSSVVAQGSASDISSERSAEHNRSDDSKLECEVKYPLESLTSSSGLDSDGPGVVVNEANSFHMSTPPANFEGFSLDVSASSTKDLRAAMLKIRYAGTILRVMRPELLEQSEKSDPLRMQQERQRVEREQRKDYLAEKARIEAQIKATNVASLRKQNDLKMRHEAKRKAARTALEKMQKTVVIDQNAGLLDDLEMKTIGCGYLYYPSEAVHHGNPLEQLGLYIKDDDVMEEDEDTISDKEEGEIPL